jgi:putative tryptophan/tyrosine transport system substrate-binding protein
VLFLSIESTGGRAVKRRAFITLIGGAAAWPLAARAEQSNRNPRIAVLMGNPEGDPRVQVNVAAFREGLQRLGWVESRNVEVEYHPAGGDPNKTRAMATEVVASKPDLIVTSSNQVTAIVQQTTRTIPIVFVFVGDPVGSGFVASLQRPGGNLTGFPNYENEIGGKWLEIFREIVPRGEQVGFIYHPDAAPNVGFYRAAESASASLNIKVIALPVRKPAEIELGISALGAVSNPGLIVPSHALFLSNRDLIVGLAARHRVPGVYGDRSFAEGGGLLSYGNNTAELFRSATSYVDRILKGEKPADLPVQLPTKYELIVNLRAAKALGIEIPSTFLFRADEVIE